MTGCTITKVSMTVTEPSYIGEVIGKAIVIAKITNAIVHFTYKGIPICCTKFDKVSEVLKYYESKTGH